MDWFDQIKAMRLEILAARLGLAMRDRHVVACLACGALGVDRQGSVASWGHGSEAEALVAALESGGGGA